MTHLLARAASDATGSAAASTAPYEALRQRHLQDMRSRIPEILQRLTWPAEKLKAERERRLRELLQIAKQRSAWHRTRLARIDPDRATEASLQDIAPMTKDDLMANFDAISTDARLTLDVAEAHLAGLKSDAYLLDRYHVIASGGSSGRRGIAVHDWDALAEGYITFMRYVMRLRMQDPALAQKRIVGAMIAAQDPTHATAAISQTFSDPSSSVWHRLAITSPFEQIVETLNSIQPDVLTSYPSMLHRLAFVAGHRALRIAPRLLFCTAEPLLPEIKDELNAAWPVPLINMWASTETGPMASSCGAGPGLHLSDDNVIIEAVDRNDQAVPIGVRSAKVLVTGLFSPAPLPLIRYEITDQVTLLDEPCKCGVTHRRLADVQGRLDDDFHYGSIHVHAHLFRSRLGKERYISEYQVRQTASGALVDVCCNVVVDVRSLRDQLISDLRRAGLPAPEVEITAVPRIERPVSGKLKRFAALSA